MQKSRIPRTRGQSLFRALLASVCVIALTATVTATTGLLQVNDVTQALSKSKALLVNNHDGSYSLPAPGDPQTILLIGSDHRTTDPSYLDANTDTMLLVRLNAASKTINLLSIPRDLKVTLPNGTTGKLNAAYTLGHGPEGLLDTLRKQVFPGFRVNHIIDINFTGFSDLIDAIGCVDTDVDHRYYNQSSGINGDPDDYSSIDIQPGYQRLCGHNQAVNGALPFVRFRHTDSDLVRNARQQDFLRWARTTFSLNDAVNERIKLLTIIGKHGQTDHNLHTTDGIINLVKLILNLNSTQINQIKFPAQTPPCDPACYVTSTKAAEARVYRQFMAASTTAPSTTAAHSEASAPDTTHAASKTSPGVTPDAADGHEQAAILGNSGMPVFYPTLVYDSPIYGPATYCSDLTDNCTAYDEPDTAYVGSYPRQYVIRADTRSYRAYRMTVAINPQLGLFYGIQGTKWLNPPILAHPTQEQTIHGRRFLEFFNGSRLDLIAWKTPTAAYWIANTLTDAIPNGEMKAIAASTKLYKP